MLGYLNSKLEGKGSPGYQKTPLRQGLLGQRRLPYHVRVVRVIVILYVVVGVLFVIKRRRGKLLLKWPGLLLSALPFYK